MLNHEICINFRIVIQHFWTGNNNEIGEASLQIYAYTFQAQIFQQYYDKTKHITYSIQFYCFLKLIVFEIRSLYRAKNRDRHENIIYAFSTNY